MNKKLVVRIIGLIFLVFGIASIINTILNLEQGLAPILWFSYIGLILLAIGVLRNDSFLIASQICILGIPYIFWNIDFFYYLFAGHSLFNIVDYFFASGPIIGKIISAQHLFNIPLSLFALYLIGMDRKDAWKLSFIELVVIFFISRIVTNFEQNVNCVFRSCSNIDFGFYYPLQWFLVYFVMVLASNWIIAKWFYRGK